MRANILKAAIFLAAIILVSSSYVAGLHAQQSSTSTPPATTNWIGNLVVGKNDSIDAIAIGGPAPTVFHQVEIGLRNDGTVVWRKVQ